MPPPISSSFPMLFALMYAVVALVAPVAAAQYFTAKLVGGREERNRFGDLLNHYIYAEEDAIVSPFPAYEIYRNGVFFPLWEEILTPRPKRDDEKAFYPNTTLTRTKTYSKSVTSRFHRQSIMYWTVIGWPEGSTTVTGTNPIIAGLERGDNKFVIRDWVFDYRGRYNVLFNVELWNGEKMRFNRTIVVDQQPAVIAQYQEPHGYNGSALEPPPIIQLENLIQQRVKTSTAIVRFVIVSGPGVDTGAVSYSSNKDGACELNRVVLSLPGSYVYRIEATLSSGAVLTTRQYSLLIEKALPTRIELVTNPYGIANFLLFSQPVFRVYDQKGIVQDDRTNLTLRIGINGPSFSYENQLSYATLMGTSSVAPVNYVYTFEDIWFDMPGSYGMEAVLYLDEEEHMIFNFYISVDLPPTYLVPLPLQINSIGNITIYGRYLKVPAAIPAYFAISKDSECATVDSSVVLWNEDINSQKEERSINIVPYAFGEKLYFCMKTNSQNYFSKLVQLYQQKYTESFPYIDSFPTADVSECKPLDGLLAAMYNAVGWSEAAEGRRYGCKLEPPVAGTVPPCTCPTTLRCASYKHRLFSPPSLDVGQCVCCAEWVLAVSGIAASLGMAAVLAVIYFYV